MTKPRLLVIGATGFVGSWWSQVAGGHFDVVRTSRTASAECTALDICDCANVDAVFEQVRPDYVTLLAALSDIDRCQREPDQAARINVAGALNVAVACARHGARLLYTSTDAVFDGTRGAYYEHDPPTPINVYGQTKCQAERLILDRLNTAQVVRLSLVLGWGIVRGRNSYLEKVAANLASGKPIISPTYEFRNPIDVRTLCQLLLALTKHPTAAGIFHIGARDKVARFELAREIAIRLGRDPQLIVPQTAAVPGRAPRGRDDFLASSRLQEYCPIPLPSCGEVLDRALDEAAC